MWLALPGSVVAERHTVVVSYRAARTLALVGGIGWASGQFRAPILAGIDPGLVQIVVGVLAGCFSLAAIWLSARLRNPNEARVAALEAQNAALHERLEELLRSEDK